MQGAKRSNTVDELFQEENITMNTPISSRTRAASSHASQHPGKPIDPALDNWDQFMNAPSLEGRDVNGNDSRQECVFKGIKISKELLRAFKGELTAVQKSVLALGLMMIVYDEPMRNAKPKNENNEITAEFVDGSKLNIHKAWRVVFKVNNNDEGRMLRVEGSDGNAMAELNLDSPDVTSSKSGPLSPPPPRRPAVQVQLLNAVARGAPTSRKRPAATENADEAMQGERSSKACKVPAIDSIDLPTIKVANITSYVGAHFGQTLKDMLTRDLVTEDPTYDQRADNTYRASWVLPAKKRFFAAFLQTAYAACNRHKIHITPENSHTILQHAFEALIQMMGDEQEEEKINESLTAAHQLTNDSVAVLTMSDAIDDFPVFTEMSKVNEIFQRVVDRIKEINPNQEKVDPLQMWRHCVQRCTVKYLQENLPFDGDNPFLPYIEDTDEKSSLLNSANAWDLITQNVDRDLTPELLMKLWDIRSNNGTPSDNKKISIPANNENSTCLMMLDDDWGNAGYATLTKDGYKELEKEIKSSVMKKRYKVSVSLGHEDAEEDSEEYKKTIVTLSRPKTSVVKLRNLLKGIVNSCNDGIAAAGEDKEKLLAAEFKLGMSLTRCRVLPDENPTVGMDVNNFLRLKNDQKVPFSLPNPDILDGYTLDEILEIAKQEGA